MRHLYSSKALG